MVMMLNRRDDFASRGTSFVTARTTWAGFGLYLAFVASLGAAGLGAAAPARADGDDPACAQRLAIAGGAAVDCEKEGRWG